MLLDRNYLIPFQLVCYGEFSTPFIDSATKNKRS